jgi:hypothetical protein
MTTATAPTPPHIRWLAGSDRVAHAHVGRRPMTTACGAPVIEERFAWPKLRACLACTGVIRDRLLGAIV